MFMVKLIGKLLLLPVLLALFVLYIVVAIIGGVYGVIHSLFWGIMVFAIILAACFGMWPQAIAFAIFMGLSLIVVLTLEGLTVFMGGAIGTVVTMLIT